jgi:hypothetical protein
LAARLYEQIGSDAKLLGHGDQVRLMRFEEPNHRREKRRISHALAKLVCPDSGQIEEPLRPAFVTKRCRERAKSYR